LLRIATCDDRFGGLDLTTIGQSDPDRATPTQQDLLDRGADAHRAPHRPQPPRKRVRQGLDSTDRVLVGVPVLIGQPQEPSAAAVGGIRDRRSRGGVQRVAHHGVLEPLTDGLDRGTASQ
jgi:hypothetical protein